jgi:hypothetical protein
VRRNQNDSANATNQTLNRHDSGKTTDQPDCRHACYAIQSFFTKPLKLNKLKSYKTELIDFQLKSAEKSFNRPKNNRKPDDSPIFKK